MEDRYVTITCPECGHSIKIGLGNPALEGLRDAMFREAVETEAAKATAAMASENDRLREELRRKDADIRFLSEMKARLSTKMIGESLERHCEDEFNRIRAAAYPAAEFGKDNDARAGSKGDYIFREPDGQGGELVSIMF